MMPGPLHVAISLRRALSDRNCVCEGCGRITASVVNIEGFGEVLATIPICDICQGQLEAAGISLDSAQERTVEELVAGGMSERLARVVARRWTR